MRVDIPKYIKVQGRLTSKLIVQKHAQTVLKIRPKLHSEMLWDDIKPKQAEILKMRKTCTPTADLLTRKRTVTTHTTTVCSCRSWRYLQNHIKHWHPLPSQHHSSLIVMQCLLWVRSCSGCVINWILTIILWDHHFINKETEAETQLAYKDKFGRISPGQNCKASSICLWPPTCPRSISIQQTASPLQA